MLTAPLVLHFGMACVLVVDDDEDIREAMSEALRTAGYTVLEAEDGQRALDSLRIVRPCLVLLNLMMPVMDGWHVVKAMEIDPKLASVPVCVVSAVSSKAPPASACVLQKPLHLAELLEVVGQHCRHAG